MLGDKISLDELLASEYISHYVTTERSAMNYVRIGKRTLNLDSVSYAEVQVWQDEMTVKVYFSGLANNTPLVFGENEAKELWKYLEYVAEKPIG